MELLMFNPYKLVSYEKNTNFVHYKCALRRNFLINILNMKQLVSNLYHFVFGEEVRTNGMDADGTIRVAAGDPTLSVTPLKGLELLPDRVPCENSMLDISGYRHPEEPRIFTVEGSSMSPEDISNGDKLLCIEVDAIKSIEQGKLAVIAVDREYYKSKNKELKFDYKLRHTLFNVPVGISIEKLIDFLKKITNSIFLVENQENLKTKYNEAIGFYGNERELMLSVTYRKGKLRYSFHPIDLIKYVAEYVLKHNGEEWRAKKLE